MIFEAHGAFVEVKLIGRHITGEIEVGQPIIVEVADADAAAIVNIRLVEDVERVVFDNVIAETDTGGAGGQ
jgi:hypothetical protein